MALQRGSSGAAADRSPAAAALKLLSTWVRRAAELLLSPLSPCSAERQRQRRRGSEAGRGRAAGRPGPSDRRDLLRGPREERVREAAPEAWIRRACASDAADVAPPDARLRLHQQPLPLPLGPALPQPLPRLAHLEPLPEVLANVRERLDVVDDDRLEGQHEQQEVARQSELPEGQHVGRAREVALEDEEEGDVGEVEGEDRGEARLNELRVDEEREDWEGGGEGRARERGR